MRTGPYEGIFSPLFVFLFFPTPPVFCFVFVTVWGGGWEIGVFSPLTHLGTETQYCKKRDLQLTQSSPSAVWKGQLYRRVEDTGRMLMAGSGPPVTDTPAEQSSTDLGSCGSPLPRPQREEYRRDWSPIQGALRSSRRVSRGQSWGGLSGGLWENLWPYGFGLEN